MPFHIIRNDITKVHADAIVNTANPRPVYGGGTDSAIYRAAGEKRLLAERRKIGDIGAGEAAVTPAFRLHAKYIIHTVGPVWIDGSHEEFSLLASCYRKSLLLARQLGCRSIAFPLISTGVYGFPRDKALTIALEQISAFLLDTQERAETGGETEAEMEAEADAAMETEAEIKAETDTAMEAEAEMEVFLVVFDKKAFDLSEELVQKVSAYIDENYVRDAHAREYNDAYPEENSSRRRRIADRLRLPFSKARNTGSSAEPVSSGSSKPAAAERPAPWFSSASPERPPVHDSTVLLPRPAGEREPAAAGPWPVEDLKEQMPAAAGPWPAEDLEEQMPAAAGPAAAPSAPAETGSAAAKDTARRRRSLQDIMSHVGESFQECLLRLIDERGLTDVQVYKRANIDRKLFSKIRCNAAYSPHRRTAIALAIALELNQDEMVDLLRKAGIALSPGSKFDLIISYCVENGIYDLYTINALLFDYDQPLLGA